MAVIFRAPRTYICMDVRSKMKNYLPFIITSFYEFAQTIPFFPFYNYALKIQLFIFMEGLVQASER